MFEFLKRKRLYKKTNFVTFGFDEPTTILNASHVSRELRLGDISTLKKDYGVREIDDNGLKSYTSPYDADNIIINARYGYALEYSGDVTFHDNIIEALTEYSRKRDEKIRRNYQKINGSIYSGFSSSSLYNRNIEEGIEICIIDTTGHDTSIILDVNGYPVPLDFIEEYTPMYLGKNILSNGNYIFLYKSDSPLISYFPRISHGAFYIDADNKIIHQISTSLTTMNRLELITADVEKPNKSVLSLSVKSENFLYDNWKKMYIYRDDIFHYDGYREYQQQSVSINRDRKLSQLLDI